MCEDFVDANDNNSFGAERQRLGAFAHELRVQLQTAQLSWRLLQQPGATVDGASAKLLERALGNLNTLVERTLSDVGLAAGVQRREAIDLTVFLQNVATTSTLHAESRGVTFTMDAVTAGALIGDPQLLMSAVMNLVHNALKFTKPGGDVQLIARTTARRLSMAIADQCGGLPDDTRVFTAFAERRGIDRSGLGLGLSMAMRAVRAHAGDITVRNIPGRGCVFTIEVPLQVCGVEHRRRPPVATIEA